MKRPVSQQEKNYNGWKKGHGIIFQALTLSNGLVLDLQGPFEGAYNDSKIVIENDLLQRIRKIGYLVRKNLAEQQAELPNTPYCLFGDKGLIFLQSRSLNRKCIYQKHFND